MTFRQPIEKVKKGGEIKMKNEEFLRLEVNIFRSVYQYVEENEGVIGS